MPLPYAVLTGGLDYEDGTSIIRVPIIRGYPKLSDQQSGIAYQVDNDPALFSYKLLDPRPPPLRHSPSRRMSGLTKQYIKVGQSAKNRLFGVGAPLAEDKTPLQMLVSEKGQLSRAKLLLMIFGAFLILLGTVLSSVPLVDLILFKNLKLWNGTLSYHYWQRPGVLRLTRVYIFNVSNPDGIIYNREKPRVKEVGPFVFSEDMEKVDIQFHDNGTVSYRHKKILQFRPEMSIDRNTVLTLPNIPVLTASTLLSYAPLMVQLGFSAVLATKENNKPFTRMTVDQLLFGYDDTFVTLAHAFFPSHLRPGKRMGLLLGRNGTLKEYATINTGRDNMADFGLMERLNGLDHLPQWKDSPCNSIRASEGSLFPPRAVTGSDRLTVYDKDLCRILPLERRYTENHDGITADYYTPPKDALNSDTPENRCFCSEDRYGELNCPVNGLQDISACQFGAPIYLSYPHFYDGDQSLVDAIDGMKPNESIHQTFFKINPKVGVPLQAKVRVQANIMVNRARSVPQTRNFPTVAFPIMWLEEGVEQLTPTIRNWIYLANIADVLLDTAAYGSLALGFFLLVGISTYTYRNVVFSKETIEKGKKTIRRGSSFIVNGQHRLLILRDSYTRLNTSPETEMDPDPDRDSS